MKQSVRLSAFSLIISVAALLIMAAVLFYGMHEGDNLKVYIWVAVLIGLCGTALFYMPLSISVNDSELRINRPLWIKSIPLADIQSVKLCQPTMGARRVCGSGGWFGYWGWFHESDIGHYFAYYGKASDCFLVTLKNGRKYVLGCQNVQAMVDRIKASITVC